MCRPPRDTAGPTSRDRGRSGEAPSRFPARPAREAASRGLSELRPPPSTQAWTPARGQPPGRRLPGARCSCRLLGRCGPRTPVRPLFPGGREHLMQTFSPFSAHISGPALWPPFKRLPLRPLKSTGRRSQRLGSRAPRRGRPAGSGFPLPNAAIAAANLRASPPPRLPPDPAGAPTSTLDSACGLDPAPRHPRPYRDPSSCRRARQPDSPGVSRVTWVAWPAHPPCPVSRPPDARRDAARIRPAPPSPATEVCLRPQPSGNGVLVTAPVGSEALVMLLSLLLSGAPGAFALLVQLTKPREDGPHAPANA